jgi:hypothetical protein
MTCYHAGPLQLGGRREVGVAQNHAPLCALCFVLLCLLIGAWSVLPAHIDLDIHISASADFDDYQSQSQWQQHDCEVILCTLMKRRLCGTSANKRLLPWLATLLYSILNL